jgi:O-antigen ligase
MTYHPHNARSTHNNYFDVLAQTGFVGFAIFIWLFGTFISIGNQVRKALRGQRNFKEAFANATYGATIAAMVAMMLGDWVLPFAYNQTITGFDNAVYSWIFLGSMVSLYHIIGLGGKR